MFLHILAKLLPTLPTTLFESLWLALDITMLVLWVSDGKYSIEIKYCIVKRNQCTLSSEYKELFR